VARPHERPTGGLNAGFASHSAVNSIAGRTHRVAETVALTGDPIAVLLHLLTEISQVVPTCICGLGQSRVAPCRGGGRRVRVGHWGSQKWTYQRKIKARCDGAETEPARPRVLCY